MCKNNTYTYIDIYIHVRNVMFDSDLLIKLKINLQSSIPYAMAYFNCDKRTTADIISSCIL